MSEPDSDIDLGQPSVAPTAPHVLATRISNAIVRIQRDRLGRGPRRARTTIRDDVVLVMLEDAMSKAEARLAAGGDEETVLRMRHAFQRSMEGEMRAAVEDITGCKVIAFMSANNVVPDLAAEIFVLGGFSTRQSSASTNGA